LPLFNKTENELQTGLDKWMFVFKNLVYLNDLPEALRNEVFERVFLMAEIAALSKENRKKYYNSLKDYRDMNNIVGQKDEEIAQNKQEIAELKQENAAYQQREAAYKQENAAYKQENEAYKQENAAYKQQIAEFQRRFGSTGGQINYY